MRKALFLIILLCQIHLSRAQGPIVPSEMQFGDIRLKINESARNEIQDDVDAMVQSRRYFNDKVQWAQLYLPLIEKIFAEEKVPVDFKYLAIQESALIPDAVSSSNAVGYWQFKDFTAIEMGLRVDNHIDERMNVVSSTRAAARYFKKNNFYFDNWIYALQAYQMGAGAALKVVDEREHGIKSMTITKKTYWYVKKFLAHKVAYEYAMENLPNSGRKLIEYTRTADKTIKNIASELMLDEEELASYNLWLKRGRIPQDKSYSVVVPVNANEKSAYIVASSTDSEPRKREETTPTYDGLEDPGRFPEISDNHGLFNKRQEFVNINGIPGVIGASDQKATDLAKMADIPESKFLFYNDMFAHQSIREGQVYYFKKKKAKAKVHYHTVNYNETLWEISQKYGVRLSKLLKKNRLKEPGDIKPGMILWLRYVRPANEPIGYNEVKAIEIASNKSNTIPEIAIEQRMAHSVDLDSTDRIEVELEVPEQTNGPLEVNEPFVGSQNEELNENVVKINHQVEAKETLYSISKTYGVEVMELVNWNDLNISDGIRIGQILNIWVPEDWEERIIEKEDSLLQSENEEGFIEYRVKPGDTLYAIANKFGVTIEEIQNWNKKIDLSVSIGEKIKIRP